MKEPIMCIRLALAGNCLFLDSPTGCTIWPPRPTLPADTLTRSLLQQQAVKLAALLTMPSGRQFCNPRATTGTRQGATCQGSAVGLDISLLMYLETLHCSSGLCCCPTPQMRKGHGAPLDWRR